MFFFCQQMCIRDRYSDEELSELAVEEIQHIMRFSAKPEWVRINRLIHCMPQYNVGHRAGIKAVREHVAENYPNLHLIGTPFDGIGIPDGVKQAKELDVYKRQGQLTLTDGFKKAIHCKVFMMKPLRLGSLGCLKGRRRASQKMISSASSKSMINTMNSCGLLKVTRSV